MRLPKIEIYPVQDGRFWMFRVIAGNGERVGSHEFFSSASNAKRGAKTVSRLAFIAAATGRIKVVDE